MTIDAYINPDFGRNEKLTFLAMAFFAVILCVFVILGGVKVAVGFKKKDERAVARYDDSHNRVQRFYEMIISATSVMSFSCAYVILNHIYDLMTSGKGSIESNGAIVFLYLWENGKDFMLLLLICLSCVLNSLLDKIFIPLKKLKKEEKACVRMLAMFYAIIILMYLNNIGDEDAYNPVMMYYLGLMIGRFVYFDASFADFISALKNMLKNIYLLILGLLITGILCYVGFSREYLLERNYIIVGIFYTHLFMLAAVFVLHHSHILHLLVRKPAGYDALKNGGEETYDEYDAGDTYGYGEGYEEYDDYSEYDNDEEYEDEEYYPPDGEDDEYDEEDGEYEDEYYEDDEY